MNPWLISSGALAVGAALVAVGARPRRFRAMAGALGAFPVRTPFGKLAALVVAAGTLPGAWMVAEHYAPPVQWADKSLYIQTWKDGLTSSVHLPLSKAPSPEKIYSVWGAETPRATVYLTDELYAAKFRPKLMEVSTDPKELHRMLGSLVYRNNFVGMFTYPAGCWFVLSLIMLMVGVAIDLRRLREMRNLGVHLSGNREVPRWEWNRAARKVV